MNLRFIDWIWHVRGSLALPPGQSGDDALDRLDPVFQEPGTSTERAGNRLIFGKKDPRAQDKMSVFDSGVLQIEQGAAGPVLHYRLMSRILLFCFLAPLLFLAAAQLTIYAAKHEKAPAPLSASAKAAEAKKKAERAARPQNPIDKFLGSPAPEKPKKKDKGDEDETKPKPTAAYVFAAIFAALYLVGRILEDWLVKRLFKRHLQWN